MSTMNPTLEVMPLSSAPSIATTKRRKKFIKKGRKMCKQNYQLKGATSTLGNNLFFNPQDALSCRSNHFKSTIEVVYRHMSTKVEYLQGIASLFEECNNPTAELPNKKMHHITYTNQVRFNLQIKTIVKREIKLE